MDDKTKLIFRVEKPIWLATTEKSQIIGWTTIKPTFDNGYIGKNNILIFSHLYKNALNFIILSPNEITTNLTPEFLESELDNLTKQGALKLLDTEEIDQISIVFGGIYIKTKDIFESPVLLPKDLYVLMARRESMRSAGKIKIGEKISLRHILDVYAEGIGQNLILK